MNESERNPHVSQLFVLFWIEFFIFLPLPLYAIVAIGIVPASWNIVSFGARGIDLFGFVFVAISALVMGAIDYGLARLGGRFVAAAKTVQSRRIRIFAIAALPLILAPMPVYVEPAHNGAPWTNWVGLMKSAIRHLN